VTIDVDELRALGLYDPAAPDAGQRLRHLMLLAARGATVEQMTAADRSGRLARLAAELLVLEGPDRYTAAELAEAAGVDLDRVLLLWQAAGFPEPASEDARFTAAEVEMVRITDAGAALFGEAAALQLLRVVGASMARVADASASTFITTVGAALVETDAAGEPLTEANLAAAALLPQMSMVMDGLLRQHLVEASRFDVSMTSSGFETSLTTVGFADIVGSTALASELALGEVGRAIASFERHAADVVTSEGGRVVKFIGDEVMFTVRDAAAACRAALAIVEHSSQDDVLSGVRAGIAHGDVLVRDADYFGPVVNLAARATKLARPGSVVASGAVRDAADPAADLRFTPLPARKLKGIAELVELYRVDS
jgi:class 3 adenylate cyclase